MKRFFSLSFLVLCLTVNAQIVDVNQSQHRFGIEVGEHTINGFLFLPPEVTAPIDVIIAAHGSGGLVSDCEDADEVPKFKTQFRYWQQEVPKAGRAIFFVESFCERGVDSFKSKTPPEDEVLSPYQVRAEDIKQAARLLENLTFMKDGDEIKLIDDQVWIGWSHGAGAVIAAGYLVPENTDALVFDVSSSGNEFTYGPPLSESFLNVKGIMAWYGGYNFYGYFRDGGDIFYKPIDGISIVTHCGSNDNICFKDSNEEFIQKMIDEGQDVTRHIYEDVEHSFDNANGDDPAADQQARDLARQRAFDFFDKIFDKEDEQVLGGLNKANFGLYPNPASDHLRIKTPDLSSSSFEIVDLSGKIHLSGVMTEYIDLSRINSGVYFLIAHLPDGDVQTRFLKK